MANLIQGSDVLRNSLLSGRHAAMQRMGTVGARVRQRRLELGLKIKELADAADCSTSAISELESGRSKTSTGLHRIATALDVTPEWLEGDSRERPPVRRPGGLNVGLLGDCLAALDVVLAGRAVSPEKRAETVAALYEEWSTRDVKPTRAQIIAFVRRVA